jgi:phosphotriesterase-related protein
MTRSGMVQTVTGLVAPQMLGTTLMHEHVLFDLTPEHRRVPPEDEVVITLDNVFEITWRPNDFPGNQRMQDVVIGTSEVERFKRAGGGTIVEMTIGGIFPQPKELRDISRATGVNIVLGAGFYTEGYQTPETLALSVEALTEIMIAQITEGAWGTDVKCGIIGEIGCSWPLTSFERRSLQAAARAQQATGAAITVHPGRHPDAPHKILDILEAEGADIARVIIDHMERTYLSDTDGVVALARRGCVVEYDFFGIEQSQYWMAVADIPTDYMRIHAIKRLFDEGFGHQVAISHDICTRTRLQSFGGHGYSHMLRNVIPLMKDRGFGQGEINQLLVETPARLLTLV